MMLEPDLPRTQEALGSLFSLMMTVNRYVVGVTAASFRPVTILGVEVDVLANFPSLKTNLQQSVAHAQTWGPISQSLFAEFVAIPRIGQSFRYNADQILAVLNAAQNNPDGQPNAAQKQQISACLRDLLGWLTTRRRSVEKQQVSVRTFYDLIVADHTNLATGENSIQTALDRLRTQGVQDVLNWLNSGIGSGAIMNMVANYVSTMITTLTGYLGIFQTLVDSNQTAQVALNLTLVVWQTLEGKYSSVIDDLNDAERSARAILELRDIRTAQLAWDQLTAYCVQLVTHRPK